MEDRELSPDPATGRRSAGAGATGLVERDNGRIQLAHVGPMALGALRIDPAVRQVVHANSQTAVVEPRVMQVLVALIRAEGRILSRDDLLASCWHGVVVGEDAINRVTGRLRRLLDGVGQGEFKLETITKVGYRLVPADAQAGGAVRPDPPPIASKPSIAVLPFSNLSGDPDRDYFADGMVEEIVTALSRIRSIFVIASGSSLSLRDEAADALEAARRLDVRYVLEGSVRRAGGRVRIAVKLIDTADRGQIWADRFEDDLQDVFNLQDRVALAVAGVIEPRVQHAEMRRVSGAVTDRMNGYDLYLRALWLYRGGGDQAAKSALELLGEAIAIDPNYGLALALAAVCHRDLALDPGAIEADAHRAQAVALADRALKAGGDDAEVLALAGAALGALETDIQAAIAIFDRALTLNPGSSTAWLSSGMMRLRAGEPDIAADHIASSMRLDPISPLRGRQLFGLGSARFEQGRMDEAATLLAESVKLSPMAATYPLLVAAQGHLGQPAQARAALARFATLGAGDIRQLASTAPNPRQRELCLEGLARLGPEILGG